MLNLLYPWHIQNLGIFKSSTMFSFLSDIFWCLWKIVSCYNYFCRKLPLGPFQMFGRILNTPMHLEVILTIMVIIFWNFLIIQYWSESPQVKRHLISSVTNLVRELPYELSNDLGSQKIRKYQENVKFGWRHSLVRSLPSRN